MTNFRIATSKIGRLVRSIAGIRGRSNFPSGAKASRKYACRSIRRPEWKFLCRFLGRFSASGADAWRLPASEKRQGTKSRDAEQGYWDLSAASLVVSAVGRPGSGS